MRVQENIMTLASILPATDGIARSALFMMKKENDTNTINIVMAVTIQKSAERIQSLVNSGELTNEEVDNLIEFFRNSGTQKVNLVTKAVLGRENAENIVMGIFEHNVGRDKDKLLSPIQA